MCKGITYKLARKGRLKRGNQVINLDNGHVMLNDNLIIGPDVTLKSFLSQIDPMEWKDNSIDSDRSFDSVMDTGHGKVLVNLIFFLKPTLTDILLTYLFPEEGAVHLGEHPLYYRNSERQQLHESILEKETGKTFPGEFTWGGILFGYRADKGVPTIDIYYT